MSFRNTTLASFCTPSRAYNVTVFSANPNGAKRGIRRKLTAKDRAKVNSVRRTGACLSCRMLKVPCDIPDPENPGPCKRCLTIASRPQQKGLLAFRECIRTKLRDVNIFQHTLDIEFTSLNSPKLKSLLSKTVDPIEPGSSLSLPEILTSIFTWMVPKKGVNPERSIVGALICSEEFRQLHKNDSFLEATLLEKFRVMIYSSTLAYVYDSGSREVYDSDLTMRDLHRITYAMGSDLLLYLDNVLVPHQLAKMFQAQLSGLFVVIFGIALAVAYSTAVYDSPTFDAGSDTGGQTPKTLWQALQQHLSQMLAHHLVILGARLGLVLRRDSEKEVISSLMSGIIRRGNFVWVAQQRPVELPVTGNTSLSSSFTQSELAETTENTEELFVLDIPEADAKSDPTTGALGLKKLDSYRAAPVSVRSLQTIQNSLRAIVTGEDDEDPNEMPGVNDCNPPRPRGRYLQTARRSRPRVSTSNRNTDREDSPNSRAEVYFANRSATAAFRSRKRQFGATQLSSSGESRPAQLCKVADDATPASMTMTNSDTTDNIESGSSNNNTSNSSATSTTSASPFQPLSPDLDLDMDLDIDPFGIGWLADPEPQVETELAASASTSGSNTESTLESGPQEDQDPASLSDSNNMSFPNCLQSGWSRSPHITSPTPQSPPTTRPDRGYEPSPSRATTIPILHNNSYTQSMPSYWVANGSAPSSPPHPPTPSIWGCQPSTQPSSSNTSWSAQRVQDTYTQNSSNTSPKTGSTAYPPNTSNDNTAAIWGCQQQTTLPPTQQSNTSSGSDTDKLTLARSLWACQQAMPPMRLASSRNSSPGSPPSVWAMQQVVPPPRRESSNSLNNNNRSTRFTAPEIWGSQQAVYPVSPPPPPPPTQTNSRPDTTTTRSNSAQAPSNHIWASQNWTEIQPSLYTKWGITPVSSATSSSIYTQVTASDSQSRPADIQTSNVGTTFRDSNGSETDRATNPDMQSGWKSGSKLDVWSCQSPVRYRPRQAQSQPQYSYPPPPSPPWASTSTASVSDTTATSSEKESDSDEWWTQRERRRDGERHVWVPQMIPSPSSVPSANRIGNSSFFGPVKKRPVI